MKILKVFVLLVFTILFLTSWQKDSEKAKKAFGSNEKINLKENTVYKK